MMRVGTTTMSLILPPRLENRAAEAIEIPIYEAEHFDSLRPTWLPVDPTTFRPPPRRSRASKVAAAGKFVVFLAATWGLAFASVVAPPITRDYFAKRSAAASHSVATADMAASSTNSAAPVSVAAATPAAEAKSADAVTLTVDVMSLPVSKDSRSAGFHGKHDKGSRRAGS